MKFKADEILYKAVLFKVLFPEAGLQAMFPANFDKNTCGPAVVSSGYWILFSEMLPTMVTLLKPP